MSAGWDNATLKKLKALNGKGLSTAEIGKRLGMSKNAIVGKLNRLGWNQSADTKREAKPIVKRETIKKVAKPAAKAKPAPKVKVAATKPAKPVAHTSSNKSPKNLAIHQHIIQHSLGMANLKSGQCRWPIGDPDSENFHFCGEPVFVGKPYCYEHCKQAYQFNPPKKK